TGRKARPLAAPRDHPAFLVTSLRKYIVASWGSVILRVSPLPLSLLCRRYAIALAEELCGERPRTNAKKCRQEILSSRIASRSSIRYSLSKLASFSCHS